MGFRQNINHQGWDAAGGLIGPSDPGEPYRVTLREP